MLNALRILTLVSLVIGGLHISPGMVKTGAAPKAFPLSRVTTGTSTIAEECRVPSGGWGGEHISLTVRDGAATFETDCAHGSIDQPLVLDTNGRFNVRGIYVREGGGDREQGGEKHPARYTGWSDGKKMTLTIRLLDTEQTIGEFKLAIGQQPNVNKCL